MRAAPLAILALVSAAALAACDATILDLPVPAAARTYVLAAPPDLALIQATGDEARAGAVDDELMAVFFAADLASLGVDAGPLTTAHAPFPDPLSAFRLDVDARAWVALDPLPAWLDERLRPRCPALEAFRVAVPTSTRGVELYTRIDGRRALARLDAHLAAIDAAGNATLLFDQSLPNVGDAHTDGERLWLLGGRYGLATGRLIEGRIDGTGGLVRKQPPGWPELAGGVRRVDGVRDPRAPVELLAITDQGWLMAYDGERWTVRFQPLTPTTFAHARVAYVAPGRAALTPAYVDGPRLLTIDGTTTTEITIVEPRALAEPEQVFALERGRDGDLLVGGDAGRAYRVPRDQRQAELIAEVGGELHAITESADFVWTYGPLGLTRIDRATGRACEPIQGTAYSGTGHAVALDDAILMGGGDVIQRAAYPR